MAVNLFITCNTALMLSGASSLRTSMAFIFHPRHHLNEWEPTVLSTNLCFSFLATAQECAYTARRGLKLTRDGEREKLDGGGEWLPPSSLGAYGGKTGQSRWCMERKSLGRANEFLHDIPVLGNLLKSRVVYPLYSSRIPQTAP